MLALIIKLEKVWLQNFIQTYVERDLPLLGLNIDRAINKEVMDNGCPY